MAIACLRDFTLAPLPLRSVPLFRRRMALSTRFDAALPYLRDPPPFRAPAFLVPVLLRARVRLVVAMTTLPLEMTHVRRGRDLRTIPRAGEISMRRRQDAPDALVCFAPGRRRPLGHCRWRERVTRDCRMHPVRVASLRDNP